MADVKRILVVDDHFEMLELLRSMLELSGHDYEVLAVPSAEEGMLELLQTSFDLLITDVRLPGMSGFDFVRRLRRRLADLPVIMITAYSSSQGQKEAQELGVYRYFAKPLDTDSMLTAVHTALYGEPLNISELQPAPVSKINLPNAVQRRLQSLQMETGATGLVLASVQGQVMLELGKNVRLNVPQLIAKIAENVANSFILAEQLGEEHPFTIQYHTGKSIELYNANVGREYFVTLLFDVESRRGRIGTIWVFAQRAIRDLAGMLEPLLQTAVAKPTPSRPPEPALPDPVKVGLTKEPKTAVPHIPEPIFESPPEPTEEDMADLLAALNLDENAAQTDLDTFWGDALGETESPTAMKNTLSLAEAAALVQGLPVEVEEVILPVEETAVPNPPEPVEVDMDELLAALNLSETETAVDLDEFWEGALETDESLTGKGLSFEEAVQRGLIDLKNNEE
ncbi:MAG: response regulator [Ardenticatenaceae bacterium]|nr:response regulator [Anaerolineales bacterium]MCB8920741.1 response regulator [Ardenticatenaceae bacterium]MCB8989700.1 response regulator [Ardenticatenaceae bacterium]MCB9002841.1 response regulator [Ardenticatenaceae bacterium]